MKTNIAFVFCMALVPMILGGGENMTQVGLKEALIKMLGFYKSRQLSRQVETEFQEAHQIHLDALAEYNDKHKALEDAIKDEATTLDSLQDAINARKAAADTLFDRDNDFLVDYRKLPDLNKKPLEPLLDQFNIDTETAGIIYVSDPFCTEAKIMNIKKRGVQELIAKKDPTAMEKMRSIFNATKIQLLSKGETVVKSLKSLEESDMSQRECFEEQLNEASALLTLYDPINAFDQGTERSYVLLQSIIKDLNDKIRPESIK